MELENKKRWNYDHLLAYLRIDSTTNSYKSAAQQAED